MARCSLNLSHPEFQKSAAQCREEAPDFADGLAEAQKKIEKEHTSCNRVVQPFGNGKFPQCHGKIWKYDWAPLGQRSANRKSWRMVVIVPDPSKEPLELIAAAVYQKNSIDQLSLRELAAIFLRIMKPLELCASTEPDAEEKFRRMDAGDGHTISLCYSCGGTAAKSASVDDLDAGEKQHQCPV